MPHYFIISDFAPKKEQEQTKDQRKYSTVERLEVLIKSKEKDTIPVSTTGIQVQVVRVPVDNAYQFVVTKVKALTEEELSPIYKALASTCSLPRVWQRGDKLIADDRYTLLEVGKAYSYGTLKRALTYIELAGLHLTRANAHLDEEAIPDWIQADMITFKDGTFLKKTNLTCPS